MSIFFKQPRFLQQCKTCINCRPYSNKFNNAGHYLKIVAGVGGVVATTLVSYHLIRNNIDRLYWNKSVDLRQRFNFINKVVEKCAPAVVYVEIKDPKRIDKGTDSATIVSNGSGFIVREDGWILTNAHVVINKPNATIEVKLYDGSTYVATVEDADMNIDLALIKIKTDRKLKSLNLAKSGDVAVGEWVVALGSPLSLSHSATAGVVSSVSRNASELGLRNYQMKYIQTDAPITFGNSGGPLVNLDGNVIGINNLRITAGISFAIPIDYVTKFLKHVKFAERSRNPETDNDLGITTLPMNPNNIKESMQDKLMDSNSGYPVSHGVLVWKIMHGSVGERKGLKVGDVITHVDDKPIYTASDIYYYTTDTNKRYDMRIIRKGENIMLPLSWK